MAELERMVRSATLEPELLEPVRIKASQMSLDGLDLHEGVATSRSA
jgi:hypothetical protein